MNLNFFNRSVRTLLFSNAFIHVAAGLLAPIYALYVNKIGGNLLDASFASGTFALAAGITTLVSAKYADKTKNTKLIIVLGYLVVGLGYLLYTQVHSIYTLLLVQILIGLATAIYVPAFDRIYTASMSPTKIGREWGAWDAMAYFTTAIGAFLGGAIVTLFGFNVMFIVMAGLCLFAAAYIYFSLQS